MLPGQFVWNEFDDRYVSTDRKHTYYPSVIINERLYELKISDIPVIPYFPVNAYYEWTDYRFYGLRSATAYILVFDLSNIDTFQYIRTLREQIIESRDMSDVPLMVVGNKQDLIQEIDRVPQDESPTERTVYSKAWNEVNRQKREDIASLVTKHWKCSYIECSAKYNCKVMQLFKEIMQTVDSSAMIQQNAEAYYSEIDNTPDDIDKNKCKIL
ncbi:hypothetical protein RUM44_009487 [Polyplax serrata]|uniref:Ras-like protein family member 10B n=1 Tax=Polyplax serrata TaxID=468196 RepID=A0ABR1ASV4_POLSC